MRSAGRAGQIASWAVLLVASALALFPILWLVLASFKPPVEFTDPGLLPSRLTVDAYVQAFGTSIPRWLLNSMIITVLVVAVGLVISALAAFAFARYRFRGATALFALVLASLALPEFATIIPQFVIMRQAGLLNTYAAVVLPLCANALVLFLLRQHFSQLPEELFDAARLDGAGELRLFWTVAIPLVRPGLGAAALLLFLSAWNAYLLPLVMLTRTEDYSISVGLAYLHSQVETTGAEDVWGPIAAGTTLSVLPLIVALLILQRHFVRGLTAGALRS